MSRSWALVELASVTSQHHAAADSDRLAIMEAPTLDGYRALLLRIYAFEAAVEAGCLGTPGFDLDLVRSHFKTHRLPDDLDALGVVAREVIPAPVPRIGSIEAALAWMWVVHRNTLLHGLVYRYLWTELPDTMQVAGAYLSVFEGRAGALMRTLGNAVEECSLRGRFRMIAGAACDAFRHQRHWYSAGVRVRLRQPVATCGGATIPEAKPMSHGAGGAHAPCSEDRLPWTSPRRRSYA
jgi:hypothetical protein